MAMTISLENLSSGAVSVDIELEEGRNIRARLAVGGSQDISSMATLDELDRSAALQSLIAGGKVRLRLVNGPMEVLRAAMTAGGGGSPDDVSVAVPLGHEYRLLDAEMLVSTAVGASTVTLRSATGGGGTALSSALSSAATGRVENAATATLVMASGSNVYARRSDNGVAGEMLLFVQRQS